MADIMKHDVPCDEPAAITDLRVEIEAHKANIAAMPVKIGQYVLDHPLLLEDAGLAAFRTEIATEEEAIVAKEALIAELSDMKICPNCKAFVKKNLNFCVACGTPVLDVEPATNAENCCEKCGAAIDPDAAFCGVCGAAQKEASDACLAVEPTTIAPVAQPEETLAVEETLTAEETPSTEKTLAGKLCAGCGATLEFDAMFCAECGTPVAADATPAPAANLCAGCGAPLEADAVFCAECGTPVAAAPAVSATKFCHNCGTTLTLDTVFCPECGAKN